MESRERRKFYIVIGLAAIFVAVGYFRFLHGKITFFSKPERGGEIQALVEVPAVDLKGIQPAGQPQKKASEGPRAELRDIFAPAKAPAKETTKGTAAGSPSASVPLLHRSRCLLCSLRERLSAASGPWRSSMARCCERGT